MNKVIKTLVLTATVAATALTSTVGMAEARDRSGYWREDGYKYRKPYKHRRHDGRDALVGGALGLATGMIIGGAIANSQPRYVEREIYVEPDYYPERRVYVRPVAVPTYEPWTRSWYEYCSQRYRSFNPNTGTYRGYDGLDHFCVAG